MTDHLITELDVVLLGDALVVGVIEEEGTGELCRAASRIAPVEARWAMSYEIETSVGAEAFVFGEIQHHWCPVDAHPDVLDAVCI